MLLRRCHLPPWTRYFLPFPQRGKRRRASLYQSAPSAGISCRLAAPPSLDELAQRFSLRKETLIRTFRQDTGLTPVSFLNVSRVEYAKARLRAGDDIADVGYQSGFADQSHFHKTFVRYTAATPRQYATGRSITDNK